jgi:hypothetical protein
LRQRAGLAGEEQRPQPAGQLVVAFQDGAGDLERFAWSALGGGVHAGVLQGHELDGPVAGQAGEVQRFLVHAAGQVVRLGIVGKPAHDLGQLPGGRLQVPLQLGIVGSRAELVVKRPEEPGGEADEVRAAEPVVKRDDLVNVAPD